MIKNAVGREIPEEIEAIGKLKTYIGPFDYELSGRKVGPKLKKVIPGKSKLLDSIEKAILETGLKDGMTISFHHHFRTGDYIVNMVMNAIAKLGIKDLTLAATSLHVVHAPIIEHIKNGVVTKIEASGTRGDLGVAISDGILDLPVLFRSHGARARVIETGELNIDVAFLGVPSCDEYGNANGFSGSSICGALGYAKVDAAYADNVVLITDHLATYPNLPASIPQTQVDYVVKVDSIGNPKGIISGATRVTSNPRELLMAQKVADVIAACENFKNGFSMQTGGGGASLAVTRFMRDKMLKSDIKASFALGGITKPLVELHEEGLIKNLFDTQSFDLAAAESISRNPNHVEISASYYANPFNKGCAVNNLDFVILGALEVDTEFNVNVLTGSDGVIRGAIGGHADTAAGAKVTIIVAPLVRGRIPTIVEKVNTLITPGETIDVVVTDFGIAVNPLRKDLIDSFRSAGLFILSIEELKYKAEKMTGKAEAIEYLDRIVGVVEYRDGSIIDVVRQVKKK